MSEYSPIDEEKATLLEKGDIAEESHETTRNAPSARFLHSLRTGLARIACFSNAAFLVSLSTSVWSCGYEDKKLFCKNSSSTMIYFLWCNQALIVLNLILRAVYAKKTGIAININAQPISLCRKVFYCLIIAAYIMGCLAFISYYAGHKTLATVLAVCAFGSVDVGSVFYIVDVLRLEHSDKTAQNIINATSRASALLWVITLVYVFADYWNCSGDNEQKCDRSINTTYGLCIALSLLTIPSGLAAVQLDLDAEQ